ncbi:unnamed protein product, partial [Chrysoparadoxa australica]
LSRTGKGPDLKRCMDRKLVITLNGGRSVKGSLRGYDQFMNLVLGDDTVDTTGGAEKEIGMVVLRGNSVIQ